ncbi:MAG: ABC transporter permease subunit [Rubrivivax sp.]
MTAWRSVVTVFAKEWRDALRDRRTLATVLLSSVAIGPLALVLVSVLVADLEERAEARELVVEGIAHAPTLQNWFERHTWRVRAAPPDHEAALRDRRLTDPVLVVPTGFEAALARGEAPTLTLRFSSANPRAQSALPRLQAMLDAFNREQATLRLATRGVSPLVLQAIEVQAEDLAPPAQRGGQLAAMLPYFVLIAMLYGALNAALDSTAGERERGSLEPLLMNPTSRTALVLGKWGAVSAIGMVIALLSCFSFLPGQWLLRSETLSALFRFGWREALQCLALLLPLAGALAAALMAVAIRCRSVKEAQASTTVVVLVVSLLPLVTVFNQDGERAWQLWVPALAQATLMGRVLKGEAIAPAEAALPLAVCVVVAALGIAAVARSLRRDAWR